MYTVLACNLQHLNISSCFLSSFSWLFLYVWRAASSLLLFLLPLSLCCFHQLPVGQIVLMEDRRMISKQHLIDSICTCCSHLLSLHRASLLFLFPALIHGLFPQVKISQSLNFFSRTFDLLPLLLFLQVMILYPNIAGNIRSFGNAYVIVAHALKHFHVSLLLFHALSAVSWSCFLCRAFCCSCWRACSSLQAISDKIPLSMSLLALCFMCFSSIWASLSFRTSASSRALYKKQRNGFY